MVVSIIYVNLGLDNKTESFLGKFGGSHETVQQNTLVTIPAAGGKNFEVPPSPGKNNARVLPPICTKGERTKKIGTKVFNNFM
jgi:hypothetical protein